MATLEEVYSFSTDELRTEIQFGLQRGWTMVTWYEFLIHYGQIKDVAGTVQWEGSSTDLRLLLLDIYGWLHTRKSKPLNPMWQRTHELTPVGVRRDAKSFVPDPEDLDPDEIRAVYEKAGR